MKLFYSLSTIFLLFLSELRIISVKLEDAPKSDQSHAADNRLSILESKLNLLTEQLEDLKKSKSHDCQDILKVC